MISEEKREKAKSLLRYIDEHGDMQKGYTEDDTDIIYECFKAGFVTGVSFVKNARDHYKGQIVGKRIIVTDSGKRFAYSSS